MNGGLHQTETGGLHAGLEAARCRELLHQRRDIAADGSDAHTDPPRHGLVGVAVGEKRHDARLAMADPISVAADSSDGPAATP